MSHEFVQSPSAPFQRCIKCGISNVVPGAAHGITLPGYIDMCDILSADVDSHDWDNLISIPSYKPRDSIRIYCKKCGLDGRLIDLPVNDYFTYVIVPSSYVNCKELIMSKALI